MANPAPRRLFTQCCRIAGFIAILLFTVGASAQTASTCVTDCSAANVATQLADPLTAQMLAQGLTTQASLEAAAAAACETTCANPPPATPATTGTTTTPPPPVSGTTTTPPKTDYWWIVFIAALALMIGLVAWALSRRDRTTPVEEDNRDADPPPTRRRPAAVVRRTRVETEEETQTTNDDSDEEPEAPPARRPARTISGQGLPIVIAAILAASLFTTSTASAQTPPLPQDAAIRARLAQEGVLKLGGQLAAVKSQLTRALARPERDTKALAEITKLEVRLESLEKKVNAGCAKFADVATQTKCLDILQATTSGTDQKAIEAVVTIVTGHHLSKKVYEDKEGNVTTEEFTTTTQAGGNTPCVDMTRITGATSETPSSVLRLRCPQTATIALPPPAYETIDIPKVEPFGEKWARYGRLTTYLSLAGGGAALGAGIGSIDQPEESTTNAFAEGGAWKYALVGAGTGLVTAGIIDLIVTLSSDD